MVHSWFAATVTLLVTSPVMLGQVVCAWAPAAGIRVARIAASATNGRDLYVSVYPPQIFCGGPNTAASVFLSVRPQSFAVTQTGYLHDVLILTSLSISE